jgi:ribonuclease III
MDEYKECNIIYQNLHNPSNKYINHDNLKDIFQKANILEKFSENKINIYNFRLESFQKAFTHISYTDKRHKKQGKNVVETECDNVNINMCVPIQNVSGETLEWLGDSIIQSVVAIYLWKRCPGQDEGFYTKTRSKLVKTITLGKFGEYLGFDSLLLISKHLEEYNNGRKNPKHLEDCFEAFVGALYNETEKHFKYELVTEFIINIIEKVIDLPMLILYDDNFKDQLMRYYQKMFNGKFPTYTEIKVEEIPQGDGENVPKKKIFTIAVNDVHGDELVQGTAKSKKEAQQTAAKEACRIYGLPITDNVDYFLT